MAQVKDAPPHARNKGRAVCEGERALDYRFGNSPRPGTTTRRSVRAVHELCGKKRSVLCEYGCHQRRGDCRSRIQERTGTTKSRCSRARRMGAAFCGGRKYLTFAEGRDAAAEGFTPRRSFSIAVTAIWCAQVGPWRMDSPMTFAALGSTVLAFFAFRQTRSAGFKGGTALQRIRFV